MAKEEEPLGAIILIVEDHAPTLKAMQQLVSAAFPACRLECADSAESALEQCARDRPRVVIMDISLPGIDGIEATRRIKALWPDIQVVVHSNHEAQIYRDASANAGANAFVAKSRTFSDLIAAIAGLLPATFRTGAGNG